ncbi:uncharacterized protein LOC127857481 [Dreissena polymorpha]|uniref:uncharacterized protein LOC127857481 n=1 Tax=Dreissena polymorpha TaxID=45954 RepID=UPI0022645AC8|nr:uncharacterized protein LOC127857481 [Dreissena polymorpha]
MYSAIPKVWREDFRENVTLAELNNSLVDLHILSIIYVAILMIVGVLGNILVVYIYTIKYSPSTYRSFILWLGWIDLIACTVGMPLLIYSLMYPYMFPSEAACKTLRSNLGDCIPEQVETKLDGSNLKTGLDEVKAHDAREETSNETNNKDAYSNQWISAIRKNDRLRSPSPGLVGHNLDKKSNKRICIGNRLETSRSSVSNKGPSIRTKQVTFMLFIITVVYVLSYIPHLVLMVTISIKSDFLKEMTPAGVVVYNLFLRSFVINNMANPIIYAFCDRKFRKECASVALNVLTCGRNS